MYDKLMETVDPSSARQTMQILVKYSRSMKDLLKEIQKLLPSYGPPRQMMDQSMPGSPTAEIYEVIGEVELVPTTQAIAGPNQAVGTSKQYEFNRVLDCEKAPELERVRSPPI